MKVTCLQMNMQLGCPDENFAHAAQLISKAMEKNPDVLVLPETWNTGFFPKENLSELCDNDGVRVKERLCSNRIIAHDLCLSRGYAKLLFDICKRNAESIL